MVIKNKKILAIIPARGGSKRIPRKNIKLLARKPLIAYTIEAALKSNYLDKIIVSTEDEEIGKVSKRYGATIIKRPQKLATDKANTIDVAFHVLDVLREKKYIPEIILLLQPTSPLRNTNDINNAIELFLKNKPKSVISVCESRETPYWMHKIDDKYIKPLMGLKNYNRRRQDLPKTYIENGAIFIISLEELYKNKKFLTDKTLPYIMPQERSIDIDNSTDLLLTEILIHNKIYEGKNKN